MTENALIAIRIRMLNFDYHRDSLLCIDTNQGAHAPVCEWDGVSSNSLFTWSTTSLYLDQAVMLQAELFAELAIDVALIQWNLFIKTL